MSSGRRFFLFPLFIFSISIASFANTDFGSLPLIDKLVDSNGVVNDIASSNSTQPPPPPLLPPPPPSMSFPIHSGFRPSIAVVVGVLTTMFSITFLLLLYAKHCKRGSLVAVGYGADYISSGAPQSTARKNSGIDRSLVESLPIFRFGALSGQKEGLECAVCLNKFEQSEVLRLLPKCKHGFHVECVDTWLDAHSTCPLCRYRVDPEDILLVEDVRIRHDDSHQIPPQEGRASNDVVVDIAGTDASKPGYRRVSGRHSSAGERVTDGSLQIFLNPTSYRRSLDSAKKNESSTVGCFDGRRKDELLLAEGRRSSAHGRFEHRIIVSPGPVPGLHQRWSDVQPSDLLYLRSEMIISDSRRFSSGSRFRQIQQNNQNQNLQLALDMNRETAINWSRWDNRGEVNSRSVSEITGLSRFSNRESNGNGNCNNNGSFQIHHHRHEYEQQRQRQAGLVSRWLAWISQTNPAVRSECIT